MYSVQIENLVYRPNISDSFDKALSTILRNLLPSMQLVLWIRFEVEKSWKTLDDPDVIWTRNLLIWSQTRYRCATKPAGKWVMHNQCISPNTTIEPNTKYYTCNFDVRSGRLRGQVVRRRSRKAKIEGSNPFGAKVIFVALFFSTWWSQICHNVSKCETSSRSSEKLPTRQ